MAGNDINEAVALITAGNAIVQDPSQVGAGMRTISLRILGTEQAKDELASLGEDVEDFVVQTASKIDETVKAYTAVASNQFKGVSLLDDNGNYRDTYEILQDIADVYQEILETDKKAGTNRGQALIELLAGKNRANIAASILSNPDLLRDVYETSLDSAGSAQAELDKYLASIEHIWKKFVTNGNLSGLQIRTAKLSTSSLMLLLRFYNSQKLLDFFRLLPGLAD